MRTHRGKTKNGSRGRACCFVDFDDFSQVARSSRAEAAAAQRSEFVVYARNETTNVLLISVYAIPTLRTIYHLGLPRPRIDVCIK